jgi:acetyl esterase/lipase
MSIRASLFRFFLRSAGLLGKSALSLEKKRHYAISFPKVLRPLRGTTVAAIMIGSIKARWIIPANAERERVILYLHGGGWFFGWAFLYDAFVSRLSGYSGAQALAVDYSLAPEHPFPVALNECVEAYRFLLDRGTAPDKIIVCGDSAGANMTLTMMLVLKSKGLALPAAGVCISPPTDLTTSGESFALNAEKDVLLSQSFARFAHEAYLAGHDPADPLVSPMFADLSGLPPLLIHAGGDEILLSNAKRFANKATASGVDVTFRVYPKMWHVFQIFTPYLPEARRAVAEIGRFVLRRTT